MKRTLSLIAVASLVTACGGGGSDGASASVGSMTDAEKVQSYANDMAATLTANLTLSPDPNLTGIWLKASNEIKSGTDSGSNVRYESKNISVLVMVDNGSDVTVNDCEDPGYTWIYSFSGDDLNVGGAIAEVIENNQIYLEPQSYVISGSGYDIDGVYAETYIKLTSNLNATIGNFVSDLPANFESNCAYYWRETDTIDGTIDYDSEALVVYDLSSNEYRYDNDDGNFIYDISIDGTTISAASSGETVEFEFY